MRLVGSGSKREGLWARRVHNPDDSPFEFRPANPILPPDSSVGHHWRQESRAARRSSGVTTPSWSASNAATAGTLSRPRSFSESWRPDLEEPGERVSSRLVRYHQLVITADLTLANR